MQGKANGALTMVTILVCGAAAFAGPQSARAETSLTLASSGASRYVIYRDEAAPPSVKQAAEEMQRIIRLSTDVEIPIVQTPTQPMVCLGDNQAARDVGLSTDSLPDEGFIIVTKGQNLYILGKDTPDGKPTWLGWTSRGTLFGVYDFLEKIVGVRWLLPGEYGEDIPKHSHLVVPEMTVKDAPDFVIREMTYIQERRPPQDPQPSAVKLWLLRHKIPPSSEGSRIQKGHAWDHYVSEDVLKAHPEYLAVSAKTGKPRSFARPAAVKYCTNNEGLVRAFAEGVIAWLDKNPNQLSASISPSDGGDFCECAKCRARVVPDPHGRPAYTLVILHFYNRVARVVAQKHPDRLLGGLVYYNYMYPPEKPIQMEPNVVLAWAPLNYYGWGLAKPVYRAEFERVLAGWVALTPKFIYHNYSTWMRSLNGAPVPPGLELLKLELPAAKRQGAWGADMVGQGAWGYGAVGNYILAKQMWNADVNVDDLYREWLQRAYGPGWQAMDKLYMMLEDRMMERKRAETIAYQAEMYEVNYDLIEKVHLPVFAEMEKLYLEALSRAQTEPQRKRLEMFGQNLIMLHYNMRKAGMLKEPEKSRFYRSEEAYQRFLAETEFSLALHRDHAKRYLGPIWKGQWKGD